MKRVEMESDQMPGQDSFLDVITNIVGILILLVLVVGLKSSRSVRDGSELFAANQARSEEQLRETYKVASSAATNVQEMVSRVSNVQKEADFRDGERTWLNTIVTGAEKEIGERRAKLSAEGQKDFDVRQKLNDAQMQLDELTRKQMALMAEDAAPQQLECQPTTIGKAVSGKEVHVLLSDDHLAIVPFEELLEQRNTDASANSWRLEKKDSFVRTIGPTNGFRLKYRVVSESIMRRGEAGSFKVGAVYRSTQCWFLPDSEPVGVPAADALKPDSEFFQYLKGMRADGTTVTIWTYPGNYDRLRQLKQAIRERDFHVAVWPLPKGWPISASDQGDKSLSE